MAFQARVHAGAAADAFERHGQRGSTTSWPKHSINSTSLPSAPPWGSRPVLCRLATRTCASTLSPLSRAAPDRAGRSGRHRRQCPPRIRPPRISQRPLCLLAYRAVATADTEACSSMACRALARFPYCPSKRRNQCATADKLNHVGRLWIATKPCHGACIVEPMRRRCFQIFDEVMRA
jgi:hypothetical protein